MIHEALRLFGNRRSANTYKVELLLSQNWSILARVTQKAMTLSRAAVQVANVFLIYSLLCLRLVFRTWTSRLHSNEPLEWLFVAATLVSSAGMRGNPTTADDAIPESGTVLPPRISTNCPAESSQATESVDISHIGASAARCSVV